MKIILSILLILSLSNAKMFQSVNETKATIIQKGDAKDYCPVCGMKLSKFYKTNHIHNNHQYCSIHCLVEDTKGKIPTDTKVVDTKTLKYIDAASAYYIVGSSKSGTMSMNSKYAFGSKKDALAFEKRFGGKIYTFEQAYNIAKSDFKNDLKRIDKKRSKKVYKVGKKLYNKKCDKSKINLNDFDNIANLKSYIKTNKICKVKKDKQLQAIVVYLWDIQKLKKSMSNNKSIKVPQKAKCPICGMFVAKYPKWAAQVKIDKHNLYFDGVKDMMKWIFKNEKKINKIFVTDYYTTNKIEAKKSFYVIGSNVYGPMGNELIPFSSKEKAQEFMKNHEAKMIIEFNKITKQLVKSL